MVARQDATALVARLRNAQETLAWSRQCRTEVVEQERSLRQLKSTLDHVSVVAETRPDARAQMAALRAQLFCLRQVARCTAVALSVEQSRIVQMQAALALQFADRVRTEVVLSRRARLRLLPVAGRLPPGQHQVLPPDTARSGDAQEALPGARNGGLANPHGTHT